MSSHGNGPIIAGCLTFCTSLIVTVILVGLGFKKLNVNEVGIDYSANSLTLNTKKLYHNGIHFIGVGHSFIKYPKLQLEINMEGSKAINARTNDGLVVSLETRVMYTLDADIQSLTSLYLMFKDDYELPIENICRSVLRDVASEFKGFQFWLERQFITDTMENRLKDVLKDVFIDVQTFLFSSFRLPAKFQEAIKETEVQQQLMNTVQYELIQIDQSAQALMLEAEQQVLQIAAVTNAAVQAIELDATAQVYKLNVTIAQESQGYKYIKDEMGFTNDELITLIWLEKMGNSITPQTIAVKTPKNILL